MWKSKVETMKVNRCWVLPTKQNFSYNLFLRCEYEFERVQPCTKFIQTFGFGVNCYRKFKKSCERNDSWRIREIRNQIHIEFTQSLSNLKLICHGKVLGKNKRIEWQKEICQQIYYRWIKKNYSTQEAFAREKDTHSKILR